MKPVFLRSLYPHLTRWLHPALTIKSGRDVWSKSSCLDVVTVANIFLELGTKSLKQFQENIGNSDDIQTARF
jgi:hypothetical protein